MYGIIVACINNPNNLFWSWWQHEGFSSLTAKSLLIFPGFPAHVGTTLNLQKLTATYQLIPHWLALVLLRLWRQSWRLIWVWTPAPSPWQPSPWQQRDYGFVWFRTFLPSSWLLRRRNLSAHPVGKMGQIYQKIVLSTVRTTARHYHRLLPVCMKFTQHSIHNRGSKVWSPINLFSLISKTGDEFAGVLFENFNVQVHKRTKVQIFDPNKVHVWKTYFHGCTIFKDFYVANSSNFLTWKRHFT